MVHPCSEQDPESHAGADIEDDWDVQPEQEVTEDADTVDPGAVPGGAEG